MYYEELESDKEIFRNYIDKKNDILKCEKEKYIWYLNLEDIIFKYLGINRYLFLNTEKFKSFPIKVYHDDSKEDLKNRIDEVAVFLDKVELEYKELYKNLNLDEFNKSCIYKQRYFNLTINNDILNDIKLISITTTDESSGVYYEIPKSDNYDMKETIDNKEYFYKKAIGTFTKENIKFNINKNYIKIIIILEDNKEKEYTVKQFEKKYGSLSAFMYQELYTQTVTNEDPLIKKAIDLVSKHINIRSLARITFIDNLIFTQNKNAVGEYGYGNIHITTRPTFSSKLEILIHEIGHYIHDEYFNNKQFRFSTKNKSKYAKKNHKENFAECFTDLVFYRKQNERTEKMLKILDEII